MPYCMKLSGEDFCLLSSNVNEIAFRSFDQGQPSLLVSLDMSAAFDTIDHSTLLNRLSLGFGVSGSVLT